MAAKIQRDSGILASLLQNATVYAQREPSLSSSAVRRKRMPSAFTGCIAGLPGRPRNKS